MNSSYSKYALASAIALVIGAGSATAATRTDLHRSDLLGASQTNASIAASGAARTVHARHAQAIGLDGESHLLLLQRKTDRGVPPIATSRPSAACRSSVNRWWSPKTSTAI